MSAIYSESFFAFGTYAGSDAWDTTAGAGNEARAAFKLNLARAGYKVATSTNADQNTSGGFVVRSHPLYPQRHALVHSSDASAATNVGVTAAFAKKIPITDKQIFIGFGLFVPPEYVPNGANSTVPVLRVNATTDSDASWQAIGVTSGAQKECFRICNDLSIRWGTDAAQSGKKLTVGALNYLEIRISPTEVSVWLDDVFVMQKQISLIPQVIAWAFENNVNAGAGGTNMSGNPGRWALSDMYYLLNDGTAPTVRLGLTTRVIGQRANTDVDVRFVRPGNAASNYEVAAQDLVDNPPKQLQSTTVGDFDLYQTVADASGDAIRTMGMVHTVAVKALASNLEPDVHTVKPFLKYGNSAVEAADKKAMDLFQLTSPTTKTIRAMAIRPGDNSIVIVGDGEMCYVSGPNGDTSVWNRVSDTGLGFDFYGLWCRSDGGILISGHPSSGAGNSKLYWVAPGTYQITPATSAAWLTAGFGRFHVSPDGATLRMYATPFAGSGTVWGGSMTSASFNGAAPQSATSSTFAGPITASGVQDLASKPDNSMTMLVMNARTDDVQVTTATAGNAWATRAHGDVGAQYTCVTWDGTAWIIGAESNNGSFGYAPRMRRSLDGSAWSPVTAIGNNNAGANQTLRFGESNLANGESIFGGDGGALVMSTDGINWRQLPRITTQPLYAAVVLTNGDFVIGGGGGVLLRFKSPGSDTALQPLAGFTMAYGSAVLNPATNAAWTPAEAADAMFGVKLTS